MDKSEKSFIQLQKDICKKYNSEYLPATFDMLIGVALNTFESGKSPINGLRHPIESEKSANWYLWAGEYSDADDFFQPIHIKHLIDLCPSAIKYLGLAPGWRFLFDDRYEDVWHDPALLKI